MTKYEHWQNEIRSRPRTWLITGVAGFIGSNLLEKLLSLQQRVVGLDNFSTGKRENLAEVQSSVDRSQWERFTFIEGDICRLEDCRAACANAEIVLHQAALGSVPRSVKDPVASNLNNVTGFLNILTAARDAQVKRFVYASSSSVYGDDQNLPKREGKQGAPLSPYAATKLINEIYAGVFRRCYGIEVVGLRYFNVFGPRQDPNGPYAAVIPKWFDAVLANTPVQINGNGDTSRDFCYVANAVQANLLAALAPEATESLVFNVACEQRTTLLQLLAQIRMLIHGTAEGGKEVFCPERPGDVRHSLADISLARQHLGYEPTHALADGLRSTYAWHARRTSARSA